MEWKLICFWVLCLRPTCVSNVTDAVGQPVGGAAGHIIIAQEVALSIPTTATAHCYSHVVDGGDPSLWVRGYKAVEYGKQKVVRSHKTVIAAQKYWWIIKFTEQISCYSIFCQLFYIWSDLEVRNPQVGLCRNTYKMISKDVSRNE